MRYYDLTVTPYDKATGLPGSTPFRRWTSHQGAKFDPAALNIEFDIPVVPFATPTGGQTITIEGISLQDLQQATQFGSLVDNAGAVTQPGMYFSLKAGMTNGLPLANPKQAGLICAGQIFQSFGNWEGTNMSLSFVIFPGVYSLAYPGNFVLNWKKGITLAAALQNCLETAFPSIPVKVTIGANLVNNFDSIHFTATLEGLAKWVGDWTKAKYNDEVHITVQAGTILVYDSTYTPTPIEIQFADLIGQPVWVKPNQMQIKLVMRGDLQLGSLIKMPQGFQDFPGLVTTYAGSLPSSLKYASAFKGNFVINQMRHIGNSRTPDGQAWVTVINCIPVT